MTCKCKKCGKLANVDDSVVLTSIPPQFNYSCPHCGYYGYINCSDAMIANGEIYNDNVNIKLYEIKD